MVDDKNRAVREEMARVIRRLNVLEFLILGGAAALALGGGALTALVLRDAMGTPFRTAWFASSLVLFVLPGVLVLRRERRQESSSTERKANSEDAVDGRR